MAEVRNGYLKWWQFIIGLMVIFAGIIGSYSRIEYTTESNKCDLQEFKTEVKDKINKIDDELDSVSEIKMNLKQLMQHFDVEYIEE